MPELYTYHLPNITALFSIGVGRFGLAEALQHHGADIVVSNMTELEGRR